MKTWENETDGEGGFDRLTNDLPPDLVTYANRQWTGVKLTQVRRATEKGGGLVLFETSVVEFLINGAEYLRF